MQLLSKWIRTHPYLEEAVLLTGIGNGFEGSGPVGTSKICKIDHRQPQIDLRPVWVGLGGRAGPVLNRQYVLDGQFVDPILGEMLDSLLVLAAFVVKWPELCRRSHLH